jgi:hypothetical protein
MARTQPQHRQDVEKAPPPIIRSSAGLRDALFDEMDRMRSGKTSSTNANALAKLAATIVDSVEMEIAVRRFMHDMGATSEAKNGTPDWRLPSPIVLGEKKTSG